MLPCAHDMPDEGVVRRRKSPRGLGMLPCGHNMSPVSSGEQSPLIDLTAPPSTSDYLRDAWNRREFAIAMPAQDLRAQNMDTMLGQLWHLANPALLVSVYFVVFGLLLDTNRGVDNFFAFLVVGVVLFHLTQRVVQDAAVAITRNEGLIRSVQFPRILLPISTVNGQTVAFLPALAMVMAAVLLTGSGLLRDGWYWWWCWRRSSRSISVPLSSFPG